MSNQQHYIERYWRDATPADAVKEPPMVARFQHEGYKTWIIDKLIYWDRSDDPWHRDDGVCYERCQVYDAPDPGEGWRLIDPESTRRVPSDERWCPALSKWLSPDDCYCDRYEDGCFYRRRITPTVTYVPFTWEDREQLRGRWMQRKTDLVPIEQMATKFETGRCGLVVNGIYSADLLLRQWTFLDTNEPVGKKVQ